MTRFRSTMTRVAAALLALAAPALRAQESAKPVVAVLYFDNNSLGKDRADFDGMGKGIADMLITELAANPNVRVVERDRIQKLLEEQDLTRAGRIDNGTAVQLGKILQAQYMILGGFMNDGRGNNVLTARTVIVQTTQVVNPQRVQSTDDDVLALIGQLSNRITQNLRLPPVRVSDASAAPAGAPAAAPQHETPVNIQTAPAATPAGTPAVTQAAASAAAPAATKPVASSKPASKPAAQPAAARRMDTRTALLYAKALDEADRGNKPKAAELFNAVLTRMPDFAPAKTNLKKLEGR